MAGIRRPITVIVVGLLLVASLSIVAVPAAADHNPDHEDDNDRPVIVDFGAVVDKLGELVDELSDFTGSFSETVTELLFAVFFQPFLDFLRAAAALVLGVIVWYPDPTIPEVIDIHRDVYFISLLLGSAGFSWIGIVYMGYDPFGVPYERVRPLVPKLVLALVFGAVAPWLLKYPVDLAEATTAALAPSEPSFSGVLMLSGELIVVSVVEAFVVLAVLAVFAVQKIYLLFAAAVAPLIAVLWAVPFRYTRRQAEQLIGAYWGFLLLGPLEIVVVRLTIALLSVASFDAGTWVVGLGGVFLMLGLPFLVVSAGMAAAGPALATARGAASSAVNRYRSTGQNQLEDDLDMGARARGGGDRFRDGRDYRGGRR